MGTTENEPRNITEGLDPLQRPFNYYDQSTQKIYELQTVHFTSRVQLDDCLLVLEFRKRNFEHVVGLLDFAWSEKSSQCMSHFKVVMLIEKMKMVVELKSVAQVQRISKLLLDSLKGFRVIYQNFRQFVQVKQEMINFDLQDQLKVWINSNLASPFGENQLPQQPELWQDKTIASLLCCFQRQTINSFEKKKLFDYLEDRLMTPLTFANTILLVEEFIRKLGKRKQQSLPAKPMPII